MARIEELLLSKIQSIGFETISNQKLSIIIESKDEKNLDEIVEQLRANGAVDIKTYDYMNSVAAKVPISKISYYERMPGVEKLWDGEGDVHIPPIPDINIQPDLVDSIPLIMLHPEYHLPNKFPDTDQAIDGSGVKICIIDSGIDASHPDLKDQVEVIKDFTDDEDGIDYNGHGTHVAGIIAGSGNASEHRLLGVVPNASLYVAKVFAGANARAARTGILDAIEWAVNEKVDIINMSLGGEQNCDGTCHLCRISDWAADNGVAVIISAGNDGPRRGTITCPGNSRNAVVIGAINNSGILADFSSRGPTIDGRPKPDVSTPGVGIRAARAANTLMGMPIDDYYTVASGTSMAAPHATGVAALLIQIYKHYSKNEYGTSLQMEVKDIKNFMMKGTIEVGDSDASGRGVLNAPLCAKSMEDAKRIPEGFVKKVDKGESPRHESNIPKEIGMAVEIAKAHLAELGISMDCNLHFFNNRNEVVLFIGENVPKERLNVRSSVMGMYKPATQTAYVRLMELPDMASTIAHEVAHHFLASKSELGKFMKQFDVMYEVHKNGSDIAIDTIIGDVKRDHNMLFNMSKITHEGFASWVGYYVLRRFVDTIKERTFNGANINVAYLKHLIEGYENLSRNLDRKKPEYYYGRMEYCNIDGFFGPLNVPVAALVCMDIAYDVKELPAIMEVNDILVSQPAEVLIQNIQALKLTPNLRLIAMSKLLAGMVHSGDDISKVNDPKYFMNAIRRYLGDDFLATEIKGIDAKIVKRTIGTNNSGVIFGEILAEIVYGRKNDMDDLVIELSSIVNTEVGNDIVGYYRDFGTELTKIKAKEILSGLRLSDNNVKVGEAIGKLEYVKSREDILKTLNVLKNFNDDVGKLYEIVLIGEFEELWNDYLRDLKMEISIRYR